MRNGSCPNIFLKNDLLSKNVIPLRRLVGCSPQWAVRDIHFLPNKSGYILQPRRFGHPAKIFGPVTYSGAKSYQNLLVDVYGGTDYKHLGFTDNEDSILLMPVFTFTRSGFYNADVSSQQSNGYFWERDGSEESMARNLIFYGTLMYPQNYGYRGLGFSLRCLVR